MTEIVQLLPRIPVLDVGADFPMATLNADEARAHTLMDAATRLVPRAALRGLDAVSRRWLITHANAHLQEIDEIARRLGRPGGYFLAVNYEWGCTVAVRPSPDQRSACLVRTLDWAMPGLGRYIVAARVDGAAGPFVTMTWPGYTGVLQAMAPGRFCAALNQAPMRRIGGGLFPIDWLANRARVWRMPHPTPAHLLRKVFETAPDYGSARRMLEESRLASPATFSLAGLSANETCVIERTEERAHVIDGAASASNHWHVLDHGARSRGIDSEGRLAAMRSVGPVELDDTFAWLRPPILNKLTRLAMVADAALGRIVAQGYEAGEAATAPLDLPCSASVTATAAQSRP